MPWTLPVLAVLIVAAVAALLFSRPSVSAKESV